MGADSDLSKRARLPRRADDPGLARADSPAVSTAGGPTMVSASAADLRAAVHRDAAIWSLVPQEAVESPGHEPGA